MSELANTPEPPYYAVIFTSLRGTLDEEYEHTARRLVELDEQQSGYLGIESVEESSRSALRVSNIMNLCRRGAEAAECE